LTSLPAGVLILLRDQVLERKMAERQRKPEQDSEVQRLCPSPGRRISLLINFHEKIKLNKKMLNRAEWIHSSIQGYLTKDFLVVILSLMLTTQNFAKYLNKM